MRYYWIFLIFVITMTSCEDVVELDLDNAAPRLVVDARLELNEDNSTTATVLLTRSSSFYQEEITVVNDATVSVIESNGTIHNFALTGEGFYENTTLDLTSQSDSYTLNIIDGTDTYRSTQSFVSTVPYTRVEQEEISGFGDDITKITGFFNDPAGEENFYLFNYLDEFNEELDIIDDEFTDGNEAITVFFMEDLPVGTDITLFIRGLDRRGFQFYDTLIQQTADGAGGPFETQPATVRGNIINTTNTENFAFGYFNVTQVFTIEYTVQEL